jgi:hypothetical protein
MIFGTYTWLIKIRVILQRFTISFLYYSVLQLAVLKVYEMIIKHVHGSWTFKEVAQGFVLSGWCISSATKFLPTVNIFLGFVMKFHTFLFWLFDKNVPLISQNALQGRAALPLPMDICSRPPLCKTKPITECATLQCILTYQWHVFIK